MQRAALRVSGLGGRMAQGRAGPADNPKQPTNRHAPGDGSWRRIGLMKICVIGFGRFLRLVN